MAVIVKESIAWCVFRLLQKTDSGGADMTCCGRLFQMQAAATEKAQSPIVNSHIRLTISDNDEAERRWRLPEVCSLANFLGKVRWCCSMLTPAGKESELEINSLPCLQPVQLAEEWTDMVIPRRWEHQLRSRVHHWLKSLEQVQRNASEHCVSIIQPHQNKRRHQRLENGLRNGPVDSSQLMHYSEAGWDGSRDVEDELSKQWSV